MKPEPQRIRELFIAALRTADPGQRDAFLQEAAHGDAALVGEVRLLLQAHQDASGFLDAPALGATIEYGPGPITEGTGTVIGAYTLLEPIGEGGMGVVYVAEQTVPVRRQVALKVIKPGMDTKQVIARFEAERQALALMDHPNIAKVLDAGATESGRPFFVMELVRGIPVTEYCDREQLSIPERLELFVLVCRAVQHAHQKGIIHRDLKPSNVLVTVIDGAAVPKVIDFGVAKATSQSLTERTLLTGFHQFVGTPLYMSPEQADLVGVDIDTRSDIYSLGVLLYELLTGTTPFDPETLKKAAFDELRRIIREEEPPKPSTRLSSLGETQAKVSGDRKANPRRLGRSLRGELDWIVMKALEKDRRRRYETANDFAADVMRYLTDRPVEACPASVSCRLRKFAWRHKSSLLTTGLLLLALSALFGSGGWLLWERSRRQSEIRADVMLELHDANVMRQQAKWSESLETTKRARGLLHSAGGNETLKRLVDQRLSDLTLLTQVDAIFTDRLERLADRDWSTLADPVIDARYSRAFQDAGINVRTLGVEEAAEKIRGRDIRPELAAALDHWTTVRHATSGQEDPLWKKLKALASAVDPDPFRVRLRQSWSDFNVPDSRRIAAAAETLDQPMAVLMSLAMPLLIMEKEGHPWLELLRKLHQRHPHDFWINFSLADESPDPVDVLRFSTTAVALRPGNAGALLLLGEALEKLRHFDDAIAAFKEAIRLRSDFVGAHNDLGNVLRSLGRTEEATAEYREAIRIDKEYALAHLNLGRTLGSQGRLDEAIAAFKEAIRLTPGKSGLGVEHGNAHDDLGTALAMQGKLKEAIASWKLAIRFDPKNVHAHNSIAWFLATSSDPGLRNPEQAVSHAKQATTLAPKRAAAWNTLGVARYRCGDAAAAIEALTKSIALKKGGQAADFFFLAMAHKKLGHDERALTSYHEGVRWMETHGPNDEELVRFRDEAAALLQLKASTGPS